VLINKVICKIVSIWIVVSTGQLVELVKNSK